MKDEILVRIIEPGRAWFLDVAKRYKRYWQPIKGEQLPRCPGMFKGEPVEFMVTRDSSGPVHYLYLPAADGLPYYVKFANGRPLDGVAVFVEEY